MQQDRRDVRRPRVDRRGPRIERVPDGLFEGEEAVLHLIERIVAPLGIRVDESSPWADARLPDGSRGQTQTSSTCFRTSPLITGSERGIRLPVRSRDRPHGETC